MFEPSEPQTIAGTPVIAAELAWDLADTVRGHLDGALRNEIYIAIAVGDTFWAVTLLLRTVVWSELAVRADLLPRLLQWVASYRDHPAEGHLRHLIGRVRIQPLGPSRLARGSRMQPLRRVPGKLQLRPAAQGASRRLNRRKPRGSDFSRQPSAQQRSGSFGYE